MEFKNIRDAMQASFESLLKRNVPLFVTETSKDEMWDTFLNGIQDPAERQSYNCSCCRHFIKQYGNVVTLVDNKIVTMWKFTGAGPLQDSVDALDKLVRRSVIRDVFFTKFAGLGTESNIQPKDDGHPIRWSHFYIQLPRNYVTNDMRSVEALMGQYRDNRNVFKRALEEIKPADVETVLELIAQGSLYRGEEFKAPLQEFLKYQKEYESSPANRDNFCWAFSVNLPGSIAKIRNTAIGTLLQNIASGMDLDYAVSAFERIMAPANYKRPHAVVTKSMVEAAEKEIKSLGLLESLGRKYAAPEEVSVNHTLFVNRDAKKGAGLFEEMKEDTFVNPRLFSKIEEVGIDKFVEEILPTITGMEVLVENHHSGNFVSLINAKDPGAPGLFKWSNLFSWSYTNAVTDSIKEKVKAAGGQVEGELRVSLSWHNYDDLDIHVAEPNGNHIYYASKSSATGGTLDVDMNAGSGTSRNAVENIIWTNARNIKEGKYRVWVNNYNKRETKDMGFTVEVECQGQTWNFDHNQSPGQSQNIEIVEFTFSKKDGVTIDKQIKSTTVSKEKWKVASNKFHKVSMVMNSPNYWDGKGVGNKHTFFMLEGAKSDEAPRGFFNEFLKEDLVQNHKRVFEVLAGKVKVEPADKELSGLGFSSTQRNSLICTVQGKFQRTLKINF